MSKTPFTTVINLLRAQALIQERFSGELGSVHGLALNEALLLMHLEKAPLRRLTRVDLAKRLHASPSTVTRMAAPMEKIGLVARQADPRDARLAYVVLTEAGLTLVGDVRKTLERRSSELFRDRWSDAEVASLAKLLGRLTAGELGDLA
ncbi:MAG: MarR family transcriptional regulator [Pseudolabrys sp.]|jgi:DNA-binding MarR family transcriptional regulator|nr:MarR family transcriptional regulator [Pseudolabrys sp.]